MSGFGVDPADLTRAASTIDDALRGGAGAPLGDVGTGRGDGYGHAGLHGAVTEFGSAVALAGEVLTRTVESARDGLHRTATSYTQSDTAGLAGLLGVGTGLGAGLGGQLGGG